MVAVGNIHNTRMLRFLLVLIVVIVPIFIYAFYSTTTTLTPTHIHTQMAMPTPQQFVAAAATSRRHAEQITPILGPSNNTVELGPFPGEEVSGHMNKARLQDQHRKQQHRLPTIDEDALLDGGAGGASPMAGSEQASNVADELLEEQQYVQSIDAITGEQLHLQLIELIEYGC